MKLNIGCGANKLDGYINIDANPAMEADLTLDVGKSKLPYETASVDEVVSSHTIEHIPRALHWNMFNEINRVLRVGGSLFISFPDFESASRMYVSNFQGRKDVWESVIFGRRLDPWDCHVCAMITKDFVNFLKECGFHQIRTAFEEGGDCYVLVYAEKAFTLTDKADILRKEVVESGRRRH